LSRVLIFGNSGSGKSTLAKSISIGNNAAHLDLDTIAWQPVTSGTLPMRMPIAGSKKQIDTFINKNDNWVIEGCYSDLLELVIHKSDEVIFLNLPVESCIINAKSRPWEPHKYDSKAAQDKNLEMLIGWISQYPERDDHFSQQAHLKLFNEFSGTKKMFTRNS